MRKHRIGLNRALPARIAPIWALSSGPRSAERARACVRTPIAGDGYLGS